MLSFAPEPEEPEPQVEEEAPAEEPSEPEAATEEEAPVEEAAAPVVEMEEEAPAEEAAAPVVEVAEEVTAEEVSESEAERGLDATSRWTDNPFRPSNLSPEQEERLDKRDEAIRIFQETGDSSLGEELGIFPKSDSSGDAEPEAQMEEEAPAKDAAEPEGSEPKIETIRDPKTGRLYTITYDGVYNGAIDGLTDEEIERLHNGGFVELELEGGRSLTLSAPIEVEDDASETSVEERIREVEVVPLSRMRRQIARVTVRSKQETPHYYVSAEIDMTGAMSLREQINSSLEAEGVRVTVNDLVIKACATALGLHPKFNASYTDDGIRMNEDIDIGIAIAQEAGLIVPAVMDCGGKSLREVSAASKDVISRANGGTLSAEEYTGGTFSISNMGMFDITSFVAIILPPQSAMLAVGSVTERPVVCDGKVTVASMMNATLSADHRVSDGAEGARFILEIKRLLENPLSLVV